MRGLQDGPTSGDHRAEASRGPTDHAVGPSRRSRDVVMACVAAEGPLSRAQIMQVTGLSRGTVAGVVAQALEGGRLVESLAEQAGSRGRRPTVLQLPSPRGLLLALDVGHAHVGTTIATGAGEVLEQRWCTGPVDDDPVGALRSSVVRMRALVERHPRHGRTLALGVSVPQPALPDGRVAGREAPTLVPGWCGVDVHAELAALGVPLAVENDANAAALAVAAETHEPHDPGTDASGGGSVVYVKLSTGLGMGTVLDGRLVRGSSGLAGEVGHLVIAPEGQICSCGNRGCLESLASLPAVCRALAPVHGHLVPDDLGGLVARGDVPAVRALRDAGLALGTALAPALAALGVPPVVVAGPRDLSLEPTIAGVRSRLLDLLHPELARRVRVSCGPYDHTASLRGALRLAQDLAVRAG
ncbi:ROK family protein [Nocardioides sp. GY 10127]|uniref:ROK family protein n=1 Tax=Nocardioides sp. GY 10127 TaxID=2569762 RepID=UPI0010A8E5D1|nr:ROK family protein [Nocardioides sp. GY 10127]TIC80013.1 ROK family protein [Nocardioides sp. GY 10127]